MSDDLMYEVPGSRLRELTDEIERLTARLAEVERERDELLAAAMADGHTLELVRALAVPAGTAQPERCSTCGEPMDTPGCSKRPDDDRPRSEAGFHTIAGPVGSVQGSEDQ